jgi:UDPglucose 6-dehydrogenase
LKKYQREAFKIHHAVRGSGFRCELIFLAFPTPPGADGSVALKYVLGVANHLGKILQRYKVIVKKSMVPVGTMDKVSVAIAKNYSGEYDVVSTPEFLGESVALDDFMKLDRVVMGTNSDRAKKLVSDFYTPFVNHNNPVIFMDELN